MQKYVWVCENARTSYCETQSDSSKRFLTIRYFKWLWTGRNHLTFLRGRQMIATCLKHCYEAELARNVHVAMRATINRWHFRKKVFMAFQEKWDCCDRLSRCYHYRVQSACSPRSQALLESLIHSKRSLLTSSCSFNLGTTFLQHSFP